MSTTVQAASPTRAGLFIAFILRAEGGVALLLALALYARIGASWWLFLVLILAPDLALLGYLRGLAIGAWTYNAVHSYVGPALLGAIGYFLGAQIVLAIAIVWIAHIGVDRLVGYGLKYPSNPKDNHLSRLAATQ